MKVLIPMNSQDKKDIISGIFGRSPFFAVYNTEQKEVEFKKNPGGQRPRGAGITAGQFAINENVDKVVVTKIGPRAINVLQENDIEITKLGENQKTLEELIEEML
jgi:predicted Fe-Mo cluster-binding NifX family protein